MEMRKCPNGHYYDASIHAMCPYCISNRDTEKTVAFAQPSGMLVGSQAPDGELEKTVPLINHSMVSGDSEKTVPLIFQNTESKKIDPVVGWLVCTSGQEKGKDYRLHSDNNYLGRDKSMDVCINDETVSRENQAIISYDASNKKYYLSTGTGRSIVRLNGEAVFQTRELASKDKIMVGATELMFIPLCDEDFEWEK